MLLLLEITNCIQPLSHTCANESFKYVDMDTSYGPVVEQGRGRKWKKMTKVNEKGEHRNFKINAQKREGMDV